MNISVLPTQDGNWIARCSFTGQIASGFNRENSISNLNKIIERKAP